MTLKGTGFSDGTQQARLMVELNKKFSNLDDSVMSLYFKDFLSVFICAVLKCETMGRQQPMA